MFTILEMSVVVRRETQENYEGDKKNVVLYLTPKVKEAFDSLARGFGLNRSQLAEQIGKGIIPLGNQAKELVALGKSLPI